MIVSPTVDTIESSSSELPDVIRRAAANLQLERALSFARRGWAVFPCTPGKKTPLGRLAPHGHRDATIDAKIISAWWTDEPTANIGIATGSASGFFAVDIDAHHDGQVTWSEIAAEPIDTATVCTPNSGRHLYFRMPSFPVGCSVGRIGRGIDIRGNGGYVVAAGSDTPQGRYFWVRQSIIADPPDWLLARLVEGNSPRAKTTGKSIPSGRRNVDLASMAGVMRRAGFGAEGIEAALQRENATRCVPPLSPAEVRSIAVSISRYSPHAAAPQNEVPAERIRFRTAQEIFTEAPPEPHWLLPGFIAGGVVTEIDGKLKAAGKTTFIAHAVGAILRGQPFLSRPTQKTGVVWLTEERPTTFLETLKRADLQSRTDLHVLHWHDVKTVSWADVMEAAAEHAAAIGARIVIVDTVGQFAGLRGDAENNAGDALQAVEPLQIAASKGLAVLAVRHERKGGGEVGEAGRGSSAFSGAVDVVVSIRRGEGQTKSTVRVLHGLSRFTETPQTLAIELTPNGYVALGESVRLAASEAQAAILACVGAGDANAMTLEELRSSARPRLRRTTTQEALDELVSLGSLCQIGKGMKNNPYRWFKPVEVSAGTEISSGGSMES